MATKRSSTARGRPKASERAPEETRALLLDAAVEVFAKRGFRGATVDEVARKAGLSKGTFYWHFESKDQLFDALLEERLDLPAKALMAVTRDAPAEEATAPVVSHGLAGLFSEQRELVLLLHEYWSAAVRDDGMRARYVERQRELRETLAAALAERHARTGVPMTIPAEKLAAAFMALAEGLSAEAAVDPDSVDAGLFGDILSLVYDGMAARGRTA